MALVASYGLNSIFYAAGVSSVLANAAIFAIRESDLDERRATGLGEDHSEERPARWSALLRDRTILWLFVSIFASHLANAPILPEVALYIKRLHGSDNLMTATVLTAQIVMVRVALAADLTRGKRHFNALMGLFATAVAIGAVVGPVASGFLTQHFGFQKTFYTFSAVAALDSVVFTVFVPETKPAAAESLSPAQIGIAG